MALTSEKLRALMVYDPATGIFRRRKNNSVVGTVSPTTGYLLVRVAGGLYLAQRLAWLYVRGVWPTYQVDHRDTDRTNNRWGNLREATSSQNKMNATTRRDNLLGVKGVQRTQSGKYRARVGRRGEVLLDRSYDTLDEAKAAYAAASQRHYGEFARAA
jgi:hypothetical protein